MFKVGDIEIDLINDARIISDAGGMFGLVPRPLWAADYPPDSENRIPVDHRCVLVRAAGKTIVVETGYGDKVDEKRTAQLGLTRPEGGLLAGLAARGVAPEAVDIVIDTHLHADHCSGNTVITADGIKPTFPNAAYYVQRLEYADAAFPNERTRGTYFALNYEPLYQSGQLKLIDGEVEIVPGVRCVVTPGHTRGHQCVVLESGGQMAVCLSDLASLAVHFSHLAWMTAFDVEPLITLETKRVWQHWALAHDARLIFYHDPVVPVGRLHADGDKMQVIPA